MHKIKPAYFYIIVTLILLCIHLVLFLGTKVNVFPELFVYPWLVSKGILPYRDFFDHHGFLPYYILSFLAHRKDLTLIVVFYQILQLANTILLLHILKKITSLFWYPICGLLFILLNYYFSDGNFWFEHFYLLPLILMLYISVLSPEFKNKTAVLSILIFLGSLIKPTFILMIIPYSLYHRTMKLIYFNALFLFALSGVLFFKGILGIYIDAMFFFNQKAVAYIRQYHGLGIERSFFYSLIAVTGISLFIYLLKKKGGKIVLLILTTPLFFFFLSHTKISMILYVPYLIIFIGIASKLCTGKLKWAYVMMMVLMLLFTSRMVKHQLVISKNNTPYIESNIFKTCVREMKEKALISDKPIYFDSPEYYYALDIIPPNYYLIDLDFITRYREDFQKQTIKELEEKKVQAVLLRNYDKRPHQLSELDAYLRTNYKKTADTRCFSYYVKRGK